MEGVHQNRSFQRIGDTYVPMRRSPKKFVFITYRKEHVVINCSGPPCIDIMNVGITQ